MAKLTAKQRAAVPAREVGLPEKARSEGAKKEPGNRSQAKLSEPRANRSTGALAGLAGLAWVGSVVYARRMGNGSGTMGMSLGIFSAMWIAMMTAMMLPAIAPVVAAHTRTIRTRRALRTALFVGAYLLVWAAVGIPMFGALRVVDHVVGGSDTIMRNIAVGVLIAVGLYLLSPRRARSLDNCRSLLVYPVAEASIKTAPQGDVRPGVKYGVACVACTWPLMTLFIAFGVMNIWAMFVLAAVIGGERLLPRGDVVARCAGVGCLLVAALVLVSPSAATALLPNTSSMSHMATPRM
jgi:predicted metal-binding membrane protein